MNTFKLVVSTPSGNILDAEANSIILRGVCGDLAVMANHTPFVTAVKPCKAKIELADSSTRYIDIDRGLLSVSSDKVILMSGSSKFAEE